MVKLINLLAKVIPILPILIWTWFGILCIWGAIATFKYEHPNATIALLAVTTGMILIIFVGYIPIWLIKKKIEEEIKIIINGKTNSNE